MPYIYPSEAGKIPPDVQNKLDELEFYVDDDMHLQAKWKSGEENPFTYYINADYDLILGVQ
jgi:hypothetical protein